MMSTHTHITRWVLSLFLISLSPAGATAQEQDSTAAADSALVSELARELGADEQESPPSGQRAARSITATNPEISLIGDVQASYLSERERNVDLVLNEVEAAFRSFVDPYARGDIYVAVGRHAEGFAGHEEHEGEEPEDEEHGEEGLGFELEEAYLTTLSLPFQLQVRAGKFRSVFGKLNRIHPHALPFIGYPAIYGNFLGGEGLIDEGVSVSWLVPNPSFFQELTVEVTRGPGESASFATDEGNQLLYVGHLKNFWDLSRDATLELGFSGAAGPNALGATSLLGGVDLTYIWKPVRYNTYQSFTLQAEAFLSDQEDAEGDHVTSWGLYAFANYQLARRWFLIGRFDHADLPGNADWNQNTVSLTLGWFATEFQKIELGLQTTTADELDRQYGALLRAVFVIGTHGAHEY